MYTAKRGNPLSIFASGPATGDHIGICQMTGKDGVQFSITRTDKGKVCAVLAQNFDIHRRPKKENTEEVKA